MYIDLQLRYTRLHHHMFRGRTMIPLLLLLLLHESLANEVCLNISKGNIHVNVTLVEIVDEQPDHVTCEKNEFPCVFQCSFNVTEWLSGSSVCLNATVQTVSATTVYIIKQDLNCSLDLCNEIPILQLLLSLNSASSYQKEMMQLTYIRDSCVKLFSSNDEVKKTFIKVEKQIIHNIMGTSNLENRSDIIYNMGALSLKVVNISEASLNSTGTRIPIEAPQLLPMNVSFVPGTWLPVSALRTIPEEKRIIGLVSYMRHNQFQFNQEKISSMVIRIEQLGEQTLHNLNTSINMTFRIFPNTYVDNKSWLQCHYFDDNDWVWKSDGCQTYNRTSNDQTDIICACNHATPFAVLLMREPISEIHWKILSYISYIGCGLSAFFTALSLVIYVFNRKHKLDHSISIHVSLSGALFLLNTTFLLTEWGATVKQNWVCVFVAAFMHYSLLCCFTWMAIEALHLYLMLVKVFNTHYKHYLAKLSVAGWGIPGIIVGVSLGVKDFKEFYGLTELTMANTNQTNSICWIIDDSFFYSLNLAYFTLIFVFNTGILLTVASSICKMKQTLSKPKPGAGAEEKTWRNPERLSESCRSGLTVLGLTCLMGTTWGLAFLGSGYVNYPILYLFCILNSTQGFFIFLWICLSARKQQRRHMEDRMSSMPAKTSGIKSE